MLEPAVLAGPAREGVVDVRRPPVRAGAATAGAAGRASSGSASSAVVAAERIPGMAELVVSSRTGCRAFARAAPVYGRSQSIAGARPPPVGELGADAAGHVEQGDADRPPKRSSQTSWVPVGRPCEPRAVRLRTGVASARPGSRCRRALRHADALPRVAVERDLRAVRGVADADGLSSNRAAAAIASPVDEVEGVDDHPTPLARTGRTRERATTPSGVQSSRRDVRCPEGLHGIGGPVATSTIRKICPPSARQRRTGRRRRSGAVRRPYGSADLAVGRHLAARPAPAVRSTPPRSPPPAGPSAADEGKATAVWREPWS